MADARDMEAAMTALDYLQQSGKRYRDGVLDAVAECYGKMRGRDRSAIVDAIVAQFNVYELDNLEVWQAYGLSVIEDMRAHG